jgi:UDP-N-acetylmuramate dehydrogenase
MMAVRHHQALRGVLLENEPMARHTTWRVGGPAERYYQPADIADLAQFLAALPGDEPVFWVGLGSNLLVRDGGIRGTVIATSGLLNGIGQVDAVTVRVEAGVSCAKVARFCARLGLTGAEFLAGIPGTMGGALAMNAGAFGGETWRLVRAVETLDRNGQLRERSAADYSVGYRAVQGPEGEWFVAAVLELAMGDTDAAAARIRELLDKRAASQPTQQPNAGSVFRNPPDDYAARLIESCGLKGRCVGSACVSTRHANFIVNTGGASAADIEALIELVAATVQQQSGVSLVREVHIVGEESGG